MLGRASPAPCSAADLLATLGKSLAFPVPLFLLAMSPCYSMMGTSLLSADTLLSRTGTPAPTSVQSLKELSSHRYKGGEVIAPTSTLKVIPSVALAVLTLYFGFLYL